MAASKGIVAAQAAGFMAACAALSFFMIPSTALPASAPSTLGQLRHLPADSGDSSGSQGASATFSADPFDMPNMVLGFPSTSEGIVSSGDDPRSVSEKAEGHHRLSQYPDEDQELRRLDAEAAALDREVAETVKAATISAQSATTVSNESRGQGDRRAQSAQPNVPAAEVTSPTVLNGPTDPSSDGR